jgi:hypothetical protein
VEHLFQIWAMQFQGRYVRVRRCAPPLRGLASPQKTEAKSPRPTGKPKGKSSWMNNFSVGAGPSLRQPDCMVTRRS